VRGLPGSGKSTYAKKLNCLILEADMYFMQDGLYKWSGRFIHQAHEWCRDMVSLAMMNSMDVVVSNTFTQLKEFAVYLELATKFNYDVEVVRCTGEYGNTHGVPEETIAKMKARFEDYEGEVLVC
jgi:predicted kinase